jgi:hypothetical protein
MRHYSCDLAKILGESLRRGIRQMACFTQAIRRTAPVRGPALDVERQRRVHLVVDHGQSEKMG